MAYAQLCDLGFTRKAIAVRVRRIQFFRVHLGVYAVGRPPSLPIQFASAAVLACGRGAALSHVGALAVHGFAKEWPDTFDVIVAPGHDPRPQGITTHRYRGLTRADVTLRHGIRVTSLARTALDCAPGLTARTLTRTINGALHSGWLKRHQLQDVRRRFPHHPGAEHLDPILHQTQTGITLSELEDAFLAFCRRYDLPTPITNPRLGTTMVDATFPGHALIVELDSWEHHGDRRAFEADRARDAANLARGRPTVRITWRRLHDQPDREAEHLRQMLTRY